MIYHSTNLNLVSQHCHYALELQEQRIPYSRNVFAVGIVAHAVIEAALRCANEIGRELTEEETNVCALGTCERLLRDGRSFDGHGEPPMLPEDVFAGQTVAMDWLLGVEPAAPGAQVEHGIGLDADGQPVDYWKGDGLTIRTILDVVRIATEEDEESSRRVVTVRDWKTAWSTDAGALETLQRKIQAVAAWRTFGPADVLRLEVVNLRTQKVYAKDYYAEDGIEAQIAEWWRYVQTLTRALDAQKLIGPRPASPGAGCSGCPYALQCNHAADFYERRGLFRTVEQKAIAYAVMSALRDELANELRLEAQDHPLPINGGSVGFQVKEKMKLKDGGYQTLWERWSEAGGEILGFAKALGLGSGNAVKMAKALYFDRKAKADREALIDEVTEPDRTREFGIIDGEKD